VVGQYAADSRVAASKRLVEQIDAILLDEATDPDHLAEVGRLLASLHYPVPDRQSLDGQLNSLENAGDEDRRRLVDSFRPEDFGLDTLHSAIEKLQARVGFGIGPRLAFASGGVSLLDRAGRLSIDGSGRISRDAPESFIIRTRIAPARVVRHSRMDSPSRGGW
jgi:hypothetical protein